MVRSFPGTYSTVRTPPTTILLAALGEAGLSAGVISLRRLHLRTRFWEQYQCLLLCHQCVKVTDGPFSGFPITPRLFSC
ncbi:hypothetical protein BCR44DRAFT_1485261 [Catenaria anguillulae PL171]|uniref:Uncharacterized protein n=1 Tax=Catenaria anguillulae PL171 TaxID=765915 RepID=A0A1Y2HM93_9FUNG|nr:hypothetical protein BCR44DRAFT_1485261 [Catenaria anguillulae PL171]